MECFDLHGLLHFAVTDRTSGLYRRFNPLYREFKRFRASISQECNHGWDLHAVIGAFRPHYNRVWTFDDRFYVAPGYFYCKQDSYKGASWSFELVQHRNDGVVLKVNPGAASTLVIQSAVVQPVLDALLACRGFPMLHASGVIADGGAVLFSGRGGSGKSSLIMRLGMVGMPVLCDDRAILGSSQVHGLLKPFNLFKYNVPPRVLSRIGWKRRISLVARDLLYRLTSGQVKIFMKVDPIEIVRRTASDAVPLHRIYILRDGKYFRMEQTSRSAVINMLLLNERLQNSLAAPYFLTASYAGHPSLLANHWKEYGKYISSHLNGKELEFAILQVPRNLEQVTDREIMKTLRMEP